MKATADGETGEKKNVVNVQALVEATPTKELKLAKEIIYDISHLHKEDFREDSQSGTPEGETEAL